MHNKITPLSYLYTLHTRLTFMTNRKLVWTLFLTSVFLKSFAQPGSFNTGFNGTGLKSFSFKQNNSADDVKASALDAAGNLFIVGLQTTNFTQPFVLKVLPSGKLDLSFGKQGKAAVDIFPPFAFTFYPNAVVAHPDGGVVLAGYRTASTLKYPCIVKLTASGTVDANFFGSGSGYVEYNSAPASSGPGAEFTGVHMTPAGEVVATGGTDASNSSSGNFLAVKVDAYTAAPINFTTFGTNVLTVDMASGEYSSASTIDGNLLYMAGSYIDLGNGQNHFAMAAVDVNTGDLDTTVTLAIVGASVIGHTCNTIAITASKRILLGGYSTNLSGNNDFMVYKLNANYSLDYVKFYPMGSSTDSKTFSLLVHSNESFVMGGSVYDGTNYTWALLKVQSDGLVDPAFGQGGTGIQNFTVPTGLNHGITGLHLLGDGSYLLDATVRYIPSGETDIKTKKVNASNGAPVVAYASNSETTLWASDADASIADVSVRADGQLLIAGTYTDVSTSSRQPALALIKSDGSVNSSFGGISSADPGVIYLSTVAPTAVRLQMTVSALTLQPDGKMLVAGSYFNVPQSATNDVYLIRLNADGTLDNAFNGNNGYTILNVANGSPHDIAVQQDLKILVYGYANDSIALARFNADGTLDANFAAGGPSPGIYRHPGTVISDVNINKIELKVLSDQHLVCAGTTTTSGKGDFLLFKLDPTGALDLSFGPLANGTFTYNFPANDDDYASTLCIKPDGKIVVGGYTQNSVNVNYALIQLSANGFPDTTFGSTKNGTLEVNKGYSGHNIEDLEVESNNAIVAMGIVQDTKSVLSITAMRITATGQFDNTFKNKGHVVLGTGFANNAVLSGSNLYIVGASDMFDNTPLTAEIMMIRLGTGPVIKTTNLHLSDVLKTFNDDPFQLKPVSNSTAVVQYSMNHGTCATVNPTTGMVTIKCVPASPDDYLAIRAYQPSITGFTDAEVIINLTIAKAIPKIIFGTQGGLIDSVILLRVISNSPGATQFDLVQDPDNALSFLGGGNVQIQGEGCAQVMVTVFTTQNYLQGSALAAVCGYKTPQAPDAYDDEMTITNADVKTTTINVLTNDEGHTGTLVFSEVDLDPSTPDVIDSLFISPALGKFTVDSLGYVTYTPFQGFDGSGSITYTIRDSHGLVSLPAKIYVNHAGYDALQATELFTPNKDGLNDAFVIGHFDLQKENKLKIFDRNGQELFTVNNYKNDWYGELANGKQAENGIYYFVFQEGSGDSQRELKGAVELKR
jgi:uncharacterized delta-60 repeat protein/gliding motility-associated-like protein